MLQTENIQKLFTVGKYVIIFTAKRMICVEEVAAGHSGRALNAFGMEKSRSGRGELDRKSSTNDKYFRQRKKKLSVDEQGNL